MKSICVHMLARDSDDFIEICLLAVLLFVDRVIVVLDSRSKDGTREILKRLQETYKQLEVVEFEVGEPDDLVKARNKQLELTYEDWIWILDSDELYPVEVINEILKEIRNPKVDTLALTSWAVWNKEEYHVSTSRIPSARLFRNSLDLEWRGKFGKERLYREEEKLWDKDNPRPQVRVLNEKYIHFTHVKKDRWREEMGQERKADDRNLRKLPSSIINITSKIL